MTAIAFPSIAAVRRNIGLLALVMALVAAGSAQAAPRWSDGPIRSEILNVNCPSQIFGSPYLENEIGAYLGQYVDDGSPVVGEVFDIHIVLATLGNECAGTRPGIEIALPPGVTPAGTGPGIRCYIRSDGSQPFGPVSAAEGCPTRLRPGTSFHPSIPTWYSLNPEPGSPAAPAWPLPQGAQLEIQVPVVSDRVLNGIGDTSGCVCAVASVETINGSSEPEPQFTFSDSFPASGPYVNLFVFPAKKVARPVLKVPKKLGLPRPAVVRLSRLQSGDRVSVQVKVRGRTVARAAGRSKGTSLRLKVKPLRNRSAKREIRRGGKATVVAKVSGSGRKTVVLRARSRVR